MRRVHWLAISLLVLASGTVMAYSSPFGVTWETAPIRVGTGQNVGTDVIIRIPNKHYLYKDKTLLLFTTLEGVHVKQITYPAGVSQPDPFTGEPKIVYPEGEVAISVIFSVPQGLSEERKEVSALLEFQGCTERLCLRPENHVVTWELNVSAVPVSMAEARPERLREGQWTLKGLLNTKDFSDVVARGRLVALLIAFLAGVLTSFTPCVWPLIPVTLLIIGVHKKGHILSNLALSLLLVAGIATTYAVLSLVAVAIGGRIGFLFQSKAFLILIVAFLLTMGLSMLGLFNIRLPIRAQNFFARLGGKGYLGAFLSGVSLGFMATPCAGPIIGTMFVWVASVRDYLFGAELLAVYAIGLGVFYVLVGTFYGTFAARIKSVRIGNVVKKILGVALLVPAVYYLSAIVPQWNGANGPDWITDEQTAIVESLSSRRPMMVIVGARWCPPCMRLEKGLLTDPEIKGLAKKFVVLHIDATVETDEVRRLLDKYHVVGWPAVIFVSPDGKIQDGLSIIGEVPEKDEFVRILNKAATWQF